MNIIRLTGSNFSVRLCLPKRVTTVVIASNYDDRNALVNQTRCFSVQSTIESFAKTQSGIFKTISESTPVECLQKFLVSFHDTTGLPWWASIVCSTILLRTCVTVPLAIYQHYILAKVENLNLEMPAIAKELQRETSMAVKLYNWDEKTAKIQYKLSIKRQWNNLIVRDNCHPMKAGLLVFFQIPMWICYSVSLRNLVYQLPTRDFDAQITHTELTLGGFGWIPNLTAFDDSYILPVALGLLNLTIIEIQVLSKVRAPSKFQRYVTHFFRGLSVFMVPIAASVPSCLALYWTTSSACGLVQNLVLLSPKFKRLCNVPKTVTELENPYVHVLAGLNQKISRISNFMKIKS